MRGCRAAEGCHPGDAVRYVMERPATHTFYRWTFEAGVGGNANGIRMHEIKLMYCSC